VFIVDRAHEIRSETFSGTSASAWWFGEGCSFTNEVIRNFTFPTDVQWRYISRN
jgi:hypothetical protein